MEICKNQQHNTPETLDAWLTRTATMFGKKRIIHVREGEEIFQSYTQLLLQAQGFAGVLRNMGYKAGDKIILSVNQSDHFLIAFWGCILSGIIPAPMPAGDQIRATAIAAERLSNACGLLHAPVLCDASGQSSYETLKAITDRHGVDLLEVVDIIRESEIKNYQFIAPRIMPHDLAIIQFSSGSTGNPKGVMLTHKNIITNVKGYLKSVKATASDNMVFWMPYYHDFGLFGCHIYSVVVGIDQVRIDPADFIRNPLIWLKYMDKYKANITTSTNTGLQLLVKKMESANVDVNLGHVKWIMIGAEMLCLDTCLAFNRMLAPYGLKPEAILPAYGLAEATLVVTIADLEKEVYGRNIARSALHNERGAVTIIEEDIEGLTFVAVGKPVADFTIHIYDDDSKLLPHHTIGEIAIKGESITAGYINNPVATDQVIRNNMLFTGDMGFIDEEGYLFITGRKKEMIIKNGVNYFPSDVEDIIYKCAGKETRQIVACGFHDMQKGIDQLLVFVVPQSYAAEIVKKLIDKIKRVVNERMGFPPDFIIPVKSNQVPKTSSGKIMRSKLIEQFLEGAFDAIINKNAEMNNNATTISNMELDELLQQIWKEALEIIDTGKISRDTSFFSIGGDSIRSVKTMVLIEERIGFKPDPGFVYRYPTIGDQVQYIAAIDKMIEPPKDELELIVRDLVSECANLPKNKLSMTDKIVQVVSTLEDVFKINQAIKDVFSMEEIPGELLKQPSIRDVAMYLKNHCLHKYENDTGTPIFPLMNFQETLYYHSKSFLRNEPTGLSCYIIYRTSVAGDFKKALYDQAFNYLIALHPMLRAVIYEDGERPFFRLFEKEKVPAFQSNFEDISYLAKEAQVQYLKEKAREDHDHRFVITRYPLFYSKIYKTADRMHELVIHIDHLLIDGYSFVQFVKELFDTYDQLNITHQLPAITVPGKTFVDYVMIEKLRERMPAYKKSLRFALNVFRDIPPRITLPCKRELALIDKVRFDTYHTTMDDKVMNLLIKLADQHPDVSLNSLLLACYFRLMNIWSNQDDLIINMPIYNREHHFATARKVLGSFLDIFPVRTKISPGESILSIARKCEKFIRTLLEYPVSSIELTRLIAEKEGAGYGSLSNIIFSNSINMVSKDIIRNLETIQPGKPALNTGAPGTLIDLVLYSWEGKWCLDWNYVSNLLDKNLVEIMAAQYQWMLNSLVDDFVATGSLENYAGHHLLPNVYKALYTANNQTGKEYPVITIHEWIAAQAIKTPDKMAILFENEKLTYRELDESANQMAHLLQELGITANKFVALIHNRCIDLLIAQLGILKAGGAYVPIDPNYPEERIAYMLRDAGAQVIITQSCHAGLLTKITDHSIQYCIVTNEKKERTSAKIRDIEWIGKQRILACSNAPVSISSGPEDLMYMIYTSGSTGEPKGVMVRHRNAANFLYYVQQEFNIHAAERIALVTSYSFDMTITSNWGPFISGASQHILSEEKTKNIEHLLDFLAEQRITFLNITPSHFSLLVNTLCFLHKKPVLEENMTIMLGAELIHPNDLNNWLHYYPSHRFINEYGPTETTVASTFFPIPVNQENRVVLNVVPIGKPVYNTQVYILDDNKEPCMVGVPGTLYIGGAGVTKGYLNKAGKTKKAYVVNPLINNPGDIIYNTGDLAKFLEDGNIIFLGRKDHQINFKGYRIELGDIENALSSFEGVAEACAALQKDNNKQDVLVAFYTSKQDKELSHKDMAAHLTKKLPEHMVPAIYHRLPEVPINTNGKLDRKLLPQVGNLENVTWRQDYVAPRTEREAALTKVWEHVLSISRLSVHENFWHVGGDSIKSVRLIQQLKAAGFDQVKISDIFVSPTIAEMSEALKKKSPLENRMHANIVKLSSRADPSCCLFCLPYAAGNPGMYAELGRYIPDRFEMLCAQYPGHGDQRPPLSSITAYADLYVEFLCKTTVPLFLLGYSFGGYIAYDVCKKLHESGKVIAGLIMVGTTPPHHKDELMTLLSTNDENLIAHALEKNILDKQLLEKLTEEEVHNYIHLLRLDTDAMINYQFSEPCIPVNTLFLTGFEEEDKVIRNKKEKWAAYFNRCTFKDVPGGHLLIRDYPQMLAEIIEVFINERLKYTHTPVLNAQ